MSKQSTEKARTFQQENRTFKIVIGKRKNFQIEIDKKAHCLLCRVVISSVKAFNVESFAFGTHNFQLVLQCIFQLFQVIKTVDQFDTSNKLISNLIDEFESPTLISNAWLNAFVFSSI